MGKGKYNPPLSCLIRGQKIPIIGNDLTLSFFLW